MKYGIAPLVAYTGACAGACAGMAISSSCAQAQILSLEQGVGFSLKPRSGFPLHARPGIADPALMRRMAPIAPVDADDRSQDVTVAIQRRTIRFASPAMTALMPSTFIPRSRLTRYAIESRMPLGDHMIAALSWSGVKLSNKNVNVTAVPGSNRVRARDLFLPGAALSVMPGRDLSVTIDYAEALRAYGGTGADGPLGLTQEEFDALRRSLKPETQSRTRVRARWAVSPAMDISLALHHGRLDDRLTFAGGGLLPVNGGSARIMGGVLTARHQLTGHLGWFLRYGEAQLRLSAHPDKRERSLSLGAEWQDGPLRASAALARGSAPAMSALSHRPLRFEAGVEYAIRHLGQRPLRLALRLSDPDGLASTRFASDDLSTSLRAADQVRAIMASARFDW